MTIMINGILYEDNYFHHSIFSDCVYIIIECPLCYADIVIDKHPDGTFTNCHEKEIDIRLPIVCDNCFNDLPNKLNLVKKLNFIITNRVYKGQLDKFIGGMI